MNPLRDLVELYFKDRSIVNHHISSFNDFLPTLDNPNSRMQKIVDNLRVSAEDMDRGIIRLDPDKTDGRIIEIRVGRKRDDRGNIDQGAKPTIKVKLPENREADGSTHSLTPMEARLRNVNYLSPIFLDFTIVEDGIEKEPEKDVHLGDLPIMVKSRRCTLYKENLQEERESSDDMYAGASCNKAVRTPWTPADTSSSAVPSASSSPSKTGPEPRHGRIEPALRSRPRGRQGLLPEGRSPRPHPSREEARRYVDGHRPGRCRPDPTRRPR